MKIIANLFLLNRLHKWKKRGSINTRAHTHWICTRTSVHVYIYVYIVRIHETLPKSDENNCQRSGILLPSLTNLESFSLATSSFLLLIAMPFVPSSVLLVAMPEVRCSTAKSAPAARTAASPGTVPALPTTKQPRSFLGQRRLRE